MAEDPFSSYYIKGSICPQHSTNSNETSDQIHARAIWENDDCICHGHILNDMLDPNTYQRVPYAKELWDLSEAMYIKEDAARKKFLVSHVNGYVMRNDLSIMEQLINLERVLVHFKNHEYG